MKKLTIMLLLVMVSAFLLFSGCGKDDDDDNGDGGISGLPDITPANYDWDIYFLDYAAVDFRADEYMIWADWLGNSSAISEDDVFTLDINGETQEFWGGNYFGEWSFSTMANLEQGTQYDIVFKKNGNTVASKTLRMPYRANVNFPASFDPTQTASMDWEMAGNNKYQIVSLYSESEMEDEDDDWEKSIPNSARSFTFPENAVEGFGPETGYDMMLSQANFEKSGRIAFSSISFAAEFYGYGEPAKLDASELRNIAKNIKSAIK
ncbi:MAG: hypothetical protein RBR69_05620 [Candidatus Cloacimonadaceae bacterium]|jgi:hypothetical protein|nr:hypothetical protein [Candidatus Cloacimonadota bacterium]MDY0127590.1 hypothetical protein [Candidatus Cloacimonadaceae bacterium]MCB5255782.1 hypothetical protein [Candidatus Cloacimonadota bacterium]MCK9178475.1 hypothetical protein [Candidatus Cloacimonadota bacterium]MCK9243376.1 hypothetical protein [Candidatus Cloacimonadota bacterium]